VRYSRLLVSCLPPYFGYYIGRNPRHHHLLREAPRRGQYRGRFGYGTPGHGLHLQLMTVPTALGALKTAADLSVHLRNLLKQNEQLPVNEILARIIEMQELIADGRMALIDLQEQLVAKNGQIQSLSLELQRSRENWELNGRLVSDGCAYWFPEKQEPRDGPFCLACWDADKKLVRLRFQQEGEWSNSPGRSRLYKCEIHKDSRIYIPLH
jgi:hypothetical protein